MATAAVWDPPSPAVAELLRTGARMLLDAPEAIFAEVDAATLASADEAVLADPGLVAAVRRTNRSNLTTWARANVESPGARVPPNLNAEVLGIARDLVRRGLDQRSLDAYRTGQNVAWRAWMAFAFTLTDDPAVLAELLDVSARSIFAFVDETIAGIAEQVEREREQLTRGTHAERLEVVTLLLEGAPISHRRAAHRLNYALDGPHTAAIVFGDRADIDVAELERAAEAIGRAAGGRRPLTVQAGGSSLWVWVAGRAGPDPAALEGSLSQLADVRIALGPVAEGAEGFRRSHLDALSVQRLLLRAAQDVRLATYEEVEVVALATTDEARARELVERTLGPLATAAPDVRETLRVYLREGHNATRAASVLFAHRNTVLGRLERARELLPVPLDGRSLQVALALEIVRWLGPRPGAAG